MHEARNSTLLDAASVDSPEGDSAIASAPRADKKWPLPLAAILCWLLPATAATRTQRASLIRLYLLHLVLVIAGALLILGFVAWADSQSLLAASLNLWEELEKSPPGAAGFIFLVFAGIEVFHLTVAFLFASWGARDEPLRESFRNAMRQTWLHTAHFVVVIAFFGGLAIALQALAAHWKLPSFDVPPGLIAVPLGAATAAWIAFALARAIAARRHVPIIHRPPTCSSCGYNLTLIPMEGRCPECGSSVADSLGMGASGQAANAPPSCIQCDYQFKELTIDGMCPECGLPLVYSTGLGRQTGAPWERCSTLRGIARAWWKTAWIALRRPEELGRMIWLTAPTAHRSFLVVHLPVIFLIATTALGLHILRFERIDDLFALALICCLSGTFGVVCMLAAFGVVNLAALLVALPESWRTKRNMLPASIQVACYLAPYVIAWELFGAALVFGLTYEALLVEAFAEMIGVLPEFLGMAVFIIPNLVIALYYLHLVARGTKAARHANR